MLRVSHGAGCSCAKCAGTAHDVRGSVELHIHIHLPDLSCLNAQTVLDTRPMAPTLRIASPPTRTLDPGDKPIEDAYAAWVADRKTAGVPNVNAQRRKLSYHSCRKTLATWLYQMILPDGSRVSEAVVKAIMRHDQGAAHARYAETLDAQVVAVSNLPDIFQDSDGNGVDKPPQNDDTLCTRTQVDPVPKPAVETQGSPGKPSSGFPAGLETGSSLESDADHASRGPPSSGRLCPFPSDETRDDLVRVLESGASMMLAVARLLARSEVRRGIDDSER